MSLLDDTIAQVIQATHSDDYRNLPGEEEPIDYTLDPVARLTEPLEVDNLLPTAVTGREMDTLQDIDLMTTSGRERKQAQKTFRQSTPGSSASFQAAQAATGMRKMTTGDFARKMLAREGSEYEWGGTSKATGYDCSGIIQKIMQNNGFTNFPRVSGDIYAHSKKISVEKAIKTRGAILWTEGHIAVSLGNGKTIEARGEDYGVVIANAHGRFTGGGLLPELQLGKAAIEASRSKVKQKPVFTRRSFDPLNKVTSSLTTAPMVFGSIMGEVYEPKTRHPGRPSATGRQGLGFVPGKYRSIIKQAAERHGLSARLLGVIAKHESGFDPNAVSSAGAQGLFQIMPLHGLRDKAFNPKANAMKAAEIFANYLELANGNLRLALAYYNAGPNASKELIQERMRVYSDPILQELRGGN